MTDTPESMILLEELRSLGCLLSLDDFGTGYSSLNYLKHLPLNFVKIDQSFVRDLPDDSGNLAIVRVIIALAKILGFSLIAEGVETRAQAHLLKEMACDFLQGYYFSRPVPFEQVAGMLGHMMDLGDVPKLLDATDAVAVAVCHYFQRSPADTGKSYSGWKNFLDQNPERLSKK